MASVSCASAEIEPYDIAPVANRLTISAGRLDLVERHRLADPVRSSNSPRSEPASAASSSTLAVYCWKTSYWRDCGWRAAAGTPSPG